MSDFKKMLAVIRVMNNETLNDMARKLGISSSYLSSIENGNRNGSAKLLMRIIKVYKLNEKESDRLINDFVSGRKHYMFRAEKLSEEDKKKIWAIKKRQIEKETGRKNR